MPQSKCYYSFGVLHSEDGYSSMTGPLVDRNKYSLSVKGSRGTNPLNERLPLTFPSH